MQQLRADQITRFEQPTVVTVGSFDGVHLGHQALLKRLNEVAERDGLRRVVVTFDPHPRIALERSEGLQLLTSDEEKAALLAAYGVDTLVILPFNQATAAQSGEAFARDFLIGKLNARVLVAGYNHRFGHDRLSAHELQIATLAVSEVEACEIEGERVSSTLIRERIAAGDHQSAERLLGHPIELLQR